MAKTWLPESHFDTIACRPGADDRLGDVLARLEGGTACAVLPDLPRLSALSYAGGREADTLDLVRVLDVRRDAGAGEKSGVRQDVDAGEKSGTRRDAGGNSAAETLGSVHVRVANLREHIRSAGAGKESGSAIGTLIVDTSWCGPWMVRPLQLGAAASVSDLSTWLGLPGYAVCARTDAGLVRALAALGVSATQANATQEMRGPTLASDPLLSALLASVSARIQRRSDTALVVATYLEAHPGVEQVSYPGLQDDVYQQAAHATLSHGSGPLVAFHLAPDAPSAHVVEQRARAHALLAPVPKDQVRVCDYSSLRAHGQRDLVLSAGCETAMDVVSALEECLRA